ncbi:MAG TPA: 4,5-DOPA dioxygenase extradiol [Acidimicrobiales bacterium]|nr:4,5-DOPA dioxygenase extradiol [Acidimicrobiales bacterium]
MSDATTALMPTAFVGHGSPMNALERNRYTDAWRAFGASVPRPRAVLVVSAHWYVNATAVTAMGHPRTIHDFFGFPDELFAVSYPAPGAPDVADEVAEVAAPVWVGLDHDSWGLDHGTWSVLVHMFPDAEVPVLQLALDATKGYAQHLDLGRRLAALRERGVLVVGSGNVVHNLRRVDWARPEAAYDWARRFGEEAVGLLTTDPARVVDLADHPDHDLAVPTPDHFLPLLYLAGMAAESGTAADVLVDGYAMGSISMMACTVGAHAPHGTDGGPAAAPLPDPDRVPPEATNT